MPYSRAAAKALELTFREALRLGHNYIGTEHVLLALLEHEAGTGPLSDLSVDKAAVEDNVLERISLLRDAFGWAAPEGEQSERLRASAAVRWSSSERQRAGVETSRGCGSSSG